MKQLDVVLERTADYLKSHSGFIFSVVLFFVVMPALGQGPEDMGDVESEVEDAYDSILAIMKYFFIGALVLGGGYVIWAFSSKKQDATNYLIFWVIGLVFYFILNALFF